MYAQCAMVVVTMLHEFISRLCLVEEKFRVTSLCLFFFFVDTFIIFLPSFFCYLCGLGCLSSVDWEWCVYKIVVKLMGESEHLNFSDAGQKKVYKVSGRVVRVILALTVLYK